MKTHFKEKLIVLITMSILSGASVEAQKKKNSTNEPPGKLSFNHFGMATPSAGLAFMSMPMGDAPMYGLSGNLQYYNYVNTFPRVSWWSELGTGLMLSYSRGRSDRDFGYGITGTHLQSTELGWMNSFRFVDTRKVMGTFSLTPGVMFSSLSGYKIGEETSKRSTVMRSTNFMLVPDVSFSFRIKRPWYLTAGAGYCMAFGNAGSLRPSDLSGVRLALGISAMSDTYSKWDKVMKYHYQPPTTMEMKPGKHPKRSSFSKQHSDALSAKQRHRNRLESLKFWRRKKESEQKEEKEKPKNQQEEQE